jgi:hypothetical protein
MLSKESGQALPLTLAVLMLGALIITPFMAQANSGIIGSREYGQIMKENYACDAGVEHGIWRLTNDELGSQIPGVGDYITYQLPNEVNSLTPDITVTREQSGGDPGTITDTVLNTLEFDTSDCYEPSFISVASDIFTIAYRGSGNDGFIATVSIESDGQSGGVIDTLEFDTANGYTPSLINIATGIYAVAYRGTGSDGFIKTISIDANGQIGGVIDTLEFAPSDGYEPSLINVATDIFAIAYRGSGNDGFVDTISIAANGQIGGVIDTLEFDTANGYEPSILNIASGVYAIAYRGTGSDGFIKTISIAPDGHIGGVIDTLEFAPSNGYEPSLIDIATDIYAIAYRGPGNDGFVDTISIAEDGHIAGVISSLEFDTSDGYEPRIVKVTTGIYAVAYSGSSNNGFVDTISVAEDGQIGSNVIDSINIDSDCYEPEVLNTSGSVFAIAYRGPNNDGFIKTIDISSYSLYAVQSITGSTAVTALVKIPESGATSVLSWIIER